MTKHFKLIWFCAGVSACLLFGFFSDTAAGSNLQKSVQIAFNDIKIVVDGKQIEPKDGAGNKVEPFILDGTTYLPVRAIGGALGKEVSWDGGTNTVYIGKAATDGAYSRLNPAPIGTAQAINIQNYSENYNANVKITESCRGDEALKKLKAANMFNEDPPEGMEYLLLKTAVTITDVKDDKSVYLSEYSFAYFSSGNVEYDGFEIAVPPSPAFSGNVFSNATLEGYIVVTVKKDDPAPKAVFGMKYDGTGGIWFELTK